MSAWTGSSFGFALKSLAAAIEGERPALVHGDRVVSWRAFDRLSDAIGAGLLAAGLRPGDVVGHQLRNSPDYLIAFFACAKAGLVPVNVNYHYRDAELADIVARFEIRAIVQDAEFAPMLDDARRLGARIDHVFTTGASGSLTALSKGAASMPAVHDDPEARFYVATGGTTGMPKAVVWRQMDAWAAFQLSTWAGEPGTRPDIAISLEDHAARAAAAAPPNLHARSPLLMLSPLMHGAGLFTALICLLRGGTLVTLPATRFDANQAIDTVAERGVVAVSFVGDAFALPLAEALEARSDAAERIAALRFVTSSGAVFSPEVKDRLLAISPGLIIIDALGSSESAGTAVTVTTAGATGACGFDAIAGRDLKVFDDALNELPPGSDGFGILARSGPLPLGYLGEEALNARVFPTIGGVRYLMTGDRARIGADGRVEFAGRDNLCINTGGEKVFPEEVEAVLQRHPAVRDARVIGLPDARFGRRIAAVVRADAGTDAAALDAHVRAALAAYKAPRRYVFTRDSLRLNNGKPDYQAALRIAEAEST